jgi:outer membrane PBP1 activator LpoA protein
MSRFNAILLAVATLGSTAFAADPPWSITFPRDEIDSSTGLARTTVVRPLGDAPAAPAAPGTPAPAAEFGPKSGPEPVRPHIALILPTSSPQLGKLAEAVRQGFLAAAAVAGKETLPVHVTAIESEGAPLLDACKAAQQTGAKLVVAGLTRDGAQSIAVSDCPRQLVLALNEIRGEAPVSMHTISLSLETEARQAALEAINAGLRVAIIVGTNTTLSKRVQEAFEREWGRAAGDGRKIIYSGNPEEASAIRDRIANIRADVVFFALDPVEARAVRPYVSGMLPIYATSYSVDPRADAIVNVDLQGVRYMEMPWFIQPDHPAVMVYPQPKTPMSVEQERLYALGIDAFRIGQQMLKGEDSKPLDGVTGRVTLDGYHHYARVLAPAEVDGGRVIPLRP